MTTSRHHSAQDFCYSICLFVITAIVSLAYCPFVWSQGSVTNTTSTSDSAWEYLGQTKPGALPSLFAPGIVAAGLSERDIAITPDGKEIYFGMVAGRIVTVMVTRFDGTRWSEPEVAPFATDMKYACFEPALSADGNRVLFLTNRPPQGEAPRPGWGHQNIWAADRQPGGAWGAPYDLGAPINTDDNEFFPSLTRTGVLYFTRSKKGENKPAIFRSVMVDGKYGPPEALPASVNGKGSPYNACIAPDESYLVACVEGREDSITPGRPNYFVYFRSADGTWGEGQNLGPAINMPGADAISPALSPDGRYFFYASNLSDLTSLVTLKGMTMKQFSEYLTKPKNGNSDIYWVSTSVIDKLKSAPAK